MKVKIFLLTLFIGIIGVACSSDDETPMKEDPTVLIVDTFVKEELSSGNTVEKTIACFYQLYDASKLTFDDSKQSLSDMLEGYATATDGKSYKYKYLYNENDGRLCEQIEAGKYFLVVIQENTGRYACKTITCDKSKTLELKKVFNSTLPRYERENW